MEIVTSKLNPRRMGKIFIKDITTTISNEGTTIIKHVNKSLVEVKKSQDNEISDFTTKEKLRDYTINIGVMSIKEMYFLNVFKLL